MDDIIISLALLLHLLRLCLIPLRFNLLLFSLDGRLFLHGCASWCFFLLALLFLHGLDILVDSAEELIEFVLWLFLLRLMLHQHFVLSLLVNGGGWLRLSLLLFLLLGLEFLLLYLAHDFLDEGLLLEGVDCVPLLLDHLLHLVGWSRWVLAQDIGPQLIREMLEHYRQHLILCWGARGGSRS